MTDTTRAVRPLASPPDSVVRVPGSKSLTNRALICAATAAGISTIRGALVADDTEAMLGALRALGIAIDSGDDGGTTLTVHGTGGAVPAGDGSTLDARLSGTTSRFLAPLLAAGRGPYVLDAAVPMRVRPMGPVVQALRAMGADVDDLGEPDHLPMRITGPARGGRIELLGHVSSQFLSGLLLAGPLYAEGVDVRLTTPLVSAPYVVLTRAVMAAFGVEATGTSVGPATYAATDYVVEPDASAASYFFAAAAITGGRVRVEGLGRHSLQGDVGFVDLLERMGAAVEREDAGITVTGTGRLRGIDVDLTELSDTAQTLAVVAAFADGPTTLTGIGFIRGKESDRIGDTVRELQRVGVPATEQEDGFTITPSGPPRGAVVQTYDDHRMAMSFALLGLRVDGLEIADPGCVAKTYPGFFDDLDQLRRR